MQAKTAAIHHRAVKIKLRHLPPQQPQQLHFSQEETSFLVSFFIMFYKE
jgi:hypothetical protein